MTRRGRPPKNPDDRLSTHIHLRLNTKTYDRLYVQAKMKGKTVTALIRDSCEPKNTSHTV